MFDITIVQCLYCPNAYQLRKSLRSIESLNTFLLNEKQLKIQLYLEGYFGDDELYSVYKNMISHLNIKDKIMHFKRVENEGKSVVLNRALPSINSKYVMYIDSDIIFEDESIFTSYFNLLEYQNNIAQENPQKYSKIGILIPAQKEDDRHNLNLKPNDITSAEDKENFVLYFLSPNSEEAIISTYGYGFAGGCFFIEKEILTQFTYPDVGQYGLDDDIYHRTLAQNKLLVMLTPKIWIIHPFDNPTEEEKKEIEKYNHWKKIRCNQ
jgi:glycosyltransferase involved in cell wall biosynthesis